MKTFTTEMKFHFLGESEYFMTKIVCEVEIIKLTAKLLEHNYKTYLLTIALVWIRLLLLGILETKSSLANTHCYFD